MIPFQLISLNSLLSTHPSHLISPTSTSTPASASASIILSSILAFPPYRPSTIHHPPSHHPSALSLSLPLPLLLLDFTTPLPTPTSHTHTSIQFNSILLNAINHQPSTINLPRTKPNPIPMHKPINPLPTDHKPSQSTAVTYNEVKTQ